MRTKPLLRRLFLFSLGGVLALLVDIIVLQGLIELAVSPYLARTISIPAAIFTAWQFNRRFTFAASGRKMADEGLRYALVAALAVSINYGVYAGLIAFMPDLWPVKAAAAGAAVSMWVSFFGYQAFAFAQKQAA